jgi:mono/diheme cytochrome c family protein
MRKTTVFLTAAATTLVLTLCAALAAAVVIGGGLYDVASTRQHWQVTHTVLETAMQQSVRWRSRDIAEPPLTDERMVLRGAACFQAKCVQCHGAPGVAQGDIGKSMQPLPGPLIDSRHRWRARELYWVTRHGIKMSGMPAWQHRLDDDEIWDIVAFLQRRPDLNAVVYAQWLRRAPHEPVCGQGSMDARPTVIVPVDVERGRHALHQYACSACHTIPGVTSSNPLVGPPLAGIGSRQLIAGTLPNNPDNLALWLLRTQTVKPGTAMPEMGVTPQDARDMAGYLATLR